MAADSLHISISAEPIAQIGGFQVTNSMVTSLIVSGILIAFAVIVNKQLQQSSKPKGLQNFAEWIVESFIKFTQSVTGDLKKTRHFFPLITTFFLFIILNNWLGLLPGVGTISTEAPETEHAEEMAEVNHEVVEEIVHTETSEAVATAENSHETSDESAGASAEEHSTLVPVFRPGTADLNTTIALGVLSIASAQFFGLSYLGKGYLRKFFNFSDPIQFFVGILELFSEFAKIISFAFRLFGNIFAGEVLLVVIAFLVPTIAPIPFYVLELFVGFIQALVFTMLSLVFINMASISHESH